MITLNLNGKDHQLDVTEDMPLLWVIRDVVGYTGTKFGCGMGLCGPCTIHIDGQATRSCITSVSLAQGRKVTTTDHLHTDKIGEAIQQAWLDVGVAQCGYYQGGQITLATALLKSNPVPSDEQVEATMADSICRCGTHNRIKMATHNAPAKLREAKA